MLPMSEYVGIALPSLIRPRFRVIQTVHSCCHTLIPRRLGFHRMGLLAWKTWPSCGWRMRHTNGPGAVHQYCAEFSKCLTPIWKKIGQIRATRRRSLVSNRRIGRCSGDAPSHLRSALCYKLKQYEIHNQKKSWRINVGQLFSGDWRWFAIETSSKDCGERP